MFQNIINKLDFFSSRGLSSKLDSGGWVDITGRSSKLYSLKESDVCQMISSTARENFYKMINGSLCKIADGEWFKFYRYYGENNEPVTLLNTSDQNFTPLPKTEVDLGQFSFFADNSDGVSIHGSLISCSDNLVRLIRIEDIQSKYVSECFLDLLGDEYIVIGKKSITKDIEKKFDKTIRESEETGGETKRIIRGELVMSDLVNDYSRHQMNQVAHFECEVWIVLRSKCPRELGDQSAGLLEELKHRDISCSVETFCLDEVVAEISFGTTPNMKRSFRTVCASDYLSLLLPLNRHLIHHEGVPFSSADGRTNNVWVDFYNREAKNYNWLVTGESGQGKSYLMSHILLHMNLMYGDSLTVGIFDYGESIYRTARYLGAKRFDSKINPFLIKDIGFLRDFIKSVVGYEEFTKKASSELYGLIREHLSNVNNFRELVILLSNEFKEIDDFSCYFNEFWDFYTDDVVELPSIYYLNLETVPKDLIAPYILFVRELSRQKYERIMNIYDEAWVYLNLIPDSLREDIKTGRKKFEFNLYATQEIDEVDSPLASSAALALIGNTYGKVSFHQPKCESKIFSEDEKEIITNPTLMHSEKNKFAEFYVKTSDYTKVLRLYKDPLVYHLANTEKLIVQKQNKFIDQVIDRMSFRHAFNLYLREVEDVY